VNEEERRRSYRQSGSGLAGLSLRVRLGDGRNLDGRVLDASTGGVATCVDSPVPPPPGDEVEVQVGMACGTCHRVLAEVMQPEQSGRGWRFGLRFLEPLTAGNGEPRDFYRTFNRRGAYRVPIDDEDGVGLGLAVLGDDDVAVAAGEASVRNLSATGAGMFTSTVTGEAMDTGSRLLLSLRLPGVTPPLVLRAAVRNRQPHADGLYLGVEFDMNATEDALDKTEDIVGFVLDRLQHATDH